MNKIILVLTIFVFCFSVYGETKYVTQDISLEYLNSIVVVGDTVIFEEGMWHGEIIPPYHPDYSGWTTYIGNNTTICGGDLLTGWIPYNNIYYTTVTDVEYNSFTVGGINSPLLKPYPTLDLPQGYYHRSDGRIYVRMTNDEDPRNLTMCVAKYMIAPIHFRHPSNQIKFINLKVKFGSIADVIWSDFDGRTDSIVFQNLDITHAGGDLGSNHGGITTSGGLNDADSSEFSHYILVDSCRISNMMGEGYPDDQAHGVSTYGTHRFIIQNSEIHGPGIGAGIYFKDMGAQDAHFGHVARNNYIHDINGTGIQFSTHYHRDSVYSNVIENVWSGIVVWGDAEHGYLFIAHNTISNVTCKGIMVTHQSYPQNTCGVGNKIVGNLIVNSDLRACDQDSEIIGFEYVSNESCADSYTIFGNGFWNNKSNYNMYRCPSYSGNSIDQWNNYFGPDFVYDPLLEPDLSRPYSDPECSRWIDRHYTLIGAWQPYDTTTPPDSSWAVVDTSQTQLTLDTPIDLADTDRSGHVDIDDPFFIINYIFSSGLRPDIITQIDRLKITTIEYVFVNGHIDSTISVHYLNQAER